MATFTISNQYGQVTTQEAKLKTAKCRIEFNPDEEKRKKGEYGFDCLTKDLVNKINERKSVGSVSDLEAIYTPIDGLGEDTYYTPWLSLRKDQTVELTVDVKMLEGNQNGALKITGYDDTKLEIKALDGSGNQIKNISSFTKLSVKCLQTNKAPAQVRFEVNNNESGGLNVFYPEPKQVDLKWYYVFRNKNEFESIRLMSSYNQLKSFFKRAFNPALIDVNVIGTKALKIDISLNERNKCYTDLKNLCDKYIDDHKLKGKDKKTYRLKENDKDFFRELNVKAEMSDQKSKLIDLGLKNGMSDLKKQLSDFAFLEKLYSYFEECDESHPPKIIKEERVPFMGCLQAMRPDISFVPNDKTIYLYLTYVSSYDGKVEPGESLSVNPGGSIIGTQTPIMFLGCEEKVNEFNKINDNKLKFEPQGDIPHEVMHSLGLYHSFDEHNAIGMLYRKAVTDNYMDYNNDKDHTYKWQWDQLRNSKFIKE